MGYLVITEIRDDSSVSPSVKTFRYFPSRNKRYNAYVSECVDILKNAICPDINTNIIKADTELVKGAMYFASIDYTSKIFRHASIRSMFTNHRRGNSKKINVRVVETFFTSVLPHSDRMCIHEDKVQYMCFSDDTLLQQYIDDYITQCMLVINNEAIPKERTGKPYVIDTTYINTKTDRSVIFLTSDGWEKRINVFIHKIKYN